MPHLCIDDDTLVAYVDGKRDQAPVEAEIATDWVLQARRARFRPSKSAIDPALDEPTSSRGFMPVTHPGTLRPRVRTLSRWALPITAAVLGFVVGAIDIPSYFHEQTFAGALVQAPRLERVLEDIVDDQAIFGREREPIIVPPAGSKDKIEAWLTSRLNLGIKVPDLTERGLEFRGSRLFAIQGQPLFMLIYVDGKDERIGIGIGRYKLQSETALKSIEEDGVKAFGRLQDGFLYLVVGPTTDPETQSLADQLPTLLLPR